MKINESIRYKKWRIIKGGEGLYYVHRPAENFADIEAGSTFFCSTRTVYAAKEWINYYRTNYLLVEKVLP